ncbi:MAG: EAL domain-containing protein [Acidimicrobiia bacterium]|nr:EAL domain-containing protein [Acidimicrobiia bacterium]
MMAGSEHAFHELLARQLKRLDLRSNSVPPPDRWARFLQRVNAAYNDADEGRYLVERAMEISGDEMAELYERLRRTSESQLKAERDRLQTVTSHSPVGILELDDRGGVIYANPRAVEIAQRPLLESGRSLLSWVYKPDRRLLFRAVRDAHARGGDFDLTIRFHGGGGEIRWLRVHGRPLAVDGETATGGRESGTGESSNRLFISATDVTREVDAWAVGERFNALFEATTDVVAMFQPDQSLFHLNQVGAELLGIPHGSDPSDHRFADFLDDRSREVLSDRAMPAVRHGGTWTGEITIVDPSGGRHVMSLVIVGHEGPEGSVDHYSAIARDITEIKVAERALVEQATHDALTGLPNRVLLLDRLRQALVGARRRAMRLAVLYVDLDRFKVVNDSQGHVAGDKLLVQAARRLRATVRSGDTVARIGGDEFVVLCEDIDDEHHVPATARRIIEEFRRPFEVADEHAFVTVSVGVAMSHSEVETAESLLRDADVAMYRAKDAGRSRFEVFDEDMRAWVTERYSMEAALRQAIENDELMVAYQPAQDLVTGSWTLVEALARWDRPGVGPVSPSRFIPLAEETGLIGALGESVLRKACEQVARWNWALRGSEPLSIAVNVSGRQLTQPGLFETVGEVCRSKNVDPSWLILEITESVLIEDPELARRRLQELSDMGVRIAIDDFGTGYSGLSYLQQFPFDIIKIDRRFVDGLGSGDDGDLTDRAIVESVISLAHQLGYEVVAEGIETEEQRQVLTNLGCDTAQGFHMALPAPASEVEELLLADAPVRPGTLGFPGATEPGAAEGSTGS